MNSLNKCRYADEWEYAYSISERGEDSPAAYSREGSIQTLIGVNIVSYRHMPVSGATLGFHKNNPRSGKKSLLCARIACGGVIRNFYHH